MIRVRQKQRLGQRGIAAFVLAILVMRIAVPAGFMPTNLGEGWYLKLCPEGLSSQTMTALFGHQHEHTAHHSSQAAENLATQYTHCDLGAGLKDETTLSSFTDPVPSQTSTSVSVLFAASQPLPAHYPYFRSRAPPTT